MEQLMKPRTQIVLPVGIAAALLLAGCTPGAGETSDVILAKDRIDPRVIALAEDIKAAQRPEIETLNGEIDTMREILQSL